MGLFNDLFASDQKKRSKSFGLFSYLEEQDNNDLDEYQKELIKNKEYDSSNFEEEDLEDDDYYYEDDN